jgi:dienelactone hydrolase
VKTVLRLGLIRSITFYLEEQALKKPTNPELSSKGKKKHTRRNLTIAALCLVILFIFIATPALLFPKHEMPEPSGTYTVSTVEYSYTDNNRIETYTTTGEPRKINLKFWYPDTTDGLFPLVVFSHGAFGLKTSNASLFAELASQGYVVCSIDHPYHSFWTKDENGQITYLNMEYFKEVQQENAKTDKQRSFEYYQKWMNIRMGDINFVIDTILNKTKESSGGVYSLIDVEKIGLMGHSLGGSAVLGIPRQRDTIDAVIALESPYMYDITGVKNNQFQWNDQVYPVPVLNIYSDSAWDHLSEWTQYARNYALFSDSEATVFNLHLIGGGHFSLTDLSLSSPFLTRILEGGESPMDNEEYIINVNKICLDFFNRYLKNQGEFEGCDLLNDQTLCETSFE